MKKGNKKKIKVLFPPLENEYGREEDIICLKASEQKPDLKGCGYKTQINISRQGSPPDVLAICPKCGGPMIRDWSKFSFGVASRGPGFHETKIGQRRKRDMVRRNEKLAKKQWDDHKPVTLSEGAKPRNFTPGGPYDPAGPFAKKKAKPIINYKKT